MPTGADGDGRRRGRRWRGPVGADAGAVGEAAEPIGVAGAGVPAAGSVAAARSCSLAARSLDRGVIGPAALRPNAAPAPTDTRATARLSTPANARLRLGRRPPNRSRRRPRYKVGSSTQRWLAAAIGIARSASPIRAGIGSAVPRAAAGSTRIGQCQRYSEYEIRPMNRTGRRPSSRAAPLTVAPVPAAMTRAAPIVGRSAAKPGYGVSCPITISAATISPTPTAAAPALRRAGARASCTAVTATIAPRPSSHARVGSEKNAHGAATSVSTDREGE